VALTQYPGGMERASMEVVKAKVKAFRFLIYFLRV
jgi:hypothetical protein